MTRATRRWALASVAVAILASAGPAKAGGKLLRRRSQAVVPTATTTNPANANAPSPMLGTFYHTPYVIVGGDRPTTKQVA